MRHVAKFAAIGSLFFLCAVFVDTREADAQIVTTYYAPAPAVSYVPTRVGLFGWRVGYRPIVGYPAPVYAAPAYAAPTIVAPPVTTYYRAPVVVAPPVTTYYGAPIVPQRVYYAPAPPIYVYP